MPVNVPSTKPVPLFPIVTVAAGPVFELLLSAPAATVRVSPTEYPEPLCSTTSLLTVVVALHLILRWQSMRRI